MPPIKRAIKNRQTVVDFATQYGGELESLFQVAAANNVGITDDVAPGTLLLVEEKNVKVSGFFAGSELDITTLGQQAVPGGLGFMQIGTSFIVS